MLNSGWPPDLTWYKLLTDWGSVIGGVLALIAGAALYFIGRAQIHATTEAADKQIAAMKEALSAAQEQTSVAQEQISVTLRLERRRIAQETYAFLVDKFIQIVPSTLQDFRRFSRPLEGSKCQIRTTSNAGGSHENCP